MTRAETIDSIKAKLDVIGDDALATLEAMATAFSRSLPPEDATTLAAIAEGVAQAKAGQYVSPEATAELLRRPWR